MPTLGNSSELQALLGNSPNPALAQMAGVLTGNAPVSMPMNYFAGNRLVAPVSPFDNNKKRV